MTCPHCLVNFNDAQTKWWMQLENDPDGQWVVVVRSCPTCRRSIINLDIVNLAITSPRGQLSPAIRDVISTRMVRPKAVARTPVSAHVPPEVTEDYREACLVLADSPKASAALSRRCLQHVLRTVANVKPGDLSSEIQQVLDSGKLPTSIATNIDVIRNVGNFAAHPTKSKSTGEILPVEPHEAEWNLDVLEELFDFYYVQPAKAAEKKAALDKKLLDAGKPRSK